MDCPACKEALAALEYSGVEVDHCIACGGVWLDEGEVRLFFGSANETAIFLDTLMASTQEPQRKLRCPISGKLMRKAHLTSDQALTVDVSPLGIWFDRGELSALLESGSWPSEVAPIAAWMKEVFGAQTHG